MSVGLPPLLTNIKQIEDIFKFLGTYPTTCRVPSITVLIVTACGSCEQTHTDKMYLDNASTYKYAQSVIIK